MRQLLVELTRQCIQVPPDFGDTTNIAKRCLTSNPHGRWSGYVNRRIFGNLGHSETKNEQGKSKHEILIKRFTSLAQGYLCLCVVYL